MTSLSLAPDERRGWRQVYLIYGLFVLDLLTAGISGIIGVIIAHIKAGSGATVAINDHFREQIRLFWTRLVILITGGLLTFVLIGYPILLIGFIWYIWALVRGILRALEEAPIR